MKPRSKPEVVALSPEELAARIAAGRARPVDVREAFERWLERMAGSEAAPLSSFAPEAHGERADEIVFYCHSGHRSGIAAARVSALCGRPIHHLAGGLLAWKAWGGEVERLGGRKSRR